MLDFGYVSTDGSEPDLGALVNSDMLAFDTETSGTNVAKDIPYGFSLACSPNSAYYTYMDNGMFLGLLADESKLKVAHNVKFDRSMLKKFGVTVNNLCDTMIAAHLLEENRLSLEVLLKRFIKGYDIEKCGRVASILSAKVIEVIGAKMTEQKWDEAIAILKSESLLKLPQ